MAAAYDAADPRAQLAATTTVRGPAREAELFELLSLEPTVQGPGFREWLVRGQNFVVAYAEVEAGAEIGRGAQEDSYIVLVPEPGGGAVVTVGDETAPMPGRSLALVPPGRSSVRLERSGPVIRVFTAASSDLTQRALNAASYTEPDPAVAPVEPWPEVAGGPRLRVHSLGVEPQPGRFGRIFRTSSLMINALEDQQGPRDPTKLSPHSHEDFEQCSVALGGRYVHHLRWPWTPDSTGWREDRHVECGSPSILIIPAGVVHTSAAVDAGLNRLVDIFAPPRADFATAGWVLNEADFATVDPAESPSS